MTALRLAHALEDAPIYESDVVDKYPLLTVSMLRAARRRGRISWIRGKQGRAYYLPSDIEAYILSDLGVPCQSQEPAPSSNSAGSGSRSYRTRPAITDAGLSEAQIDRVALRLARQI